ncbi:hypothetical protein Dsin_004802 [Dipteronia sinensis]|uniref:Uncharacterized protein n=1 Tax=Dipteronia sinensis TaxID=43782 RepID=A0AAE0AW85_9ROSI|nr:hypothetical protein Dsin_004802 [Dipteronia sinensis]
MPSLSKFSYHRLKYEGGFDEEEEEERDFRNIRKWSSLRNFTFRKRAKLRIPVLRRFWTKRSRFFSRVKVLWRKALKRLQNGQAHMNDLFGGNYLLMMAKPTLRCGQRPFMGHNIHGLPARHSLRKIA